MSPQKVVRREPESASNLGFDGDMASRTQPSITRNVRHDLPRIAMKAVAESQIGIDAATEGLA